MLRNRIKLRGESLRKLGNENCCALLLKKISEHGKNVKLSSIRTQDYSMMRRKVRTLKDTQTNRSCLNNRQKTKEKLTVKTRAKH